MYDTCLWYALRTRLTVQGSRLCLGVESKNGFKFHCYCLVPSLVSDCCDTVECTSLPQLLRFPFSILPFRPHYRLLHGDVYQSIVRCII